MTRSLEYRLPLYLVDNAEILTAINTHSPPDKPGKLIAPGNTVWELTTHDEWKSQSVAIWECLKPLPPHRCKSDEWYSAISGSAEVFVESVCDLGQPISYTLKAGDYVMIPAGRWFFTIPDPQLLAHIINMPAFEPAHIAKLVPTNPQDADVIAFYESLCG